MAGREGFFILKFVYRPVEGRGCSESSRQLKKYIDGTLMGLQKDNRYQQCCSTKEIVAER